MSHTVYGFFLLILILAEVDFSHGAGYYTVEELTRCTSLIESSYWKQTIWPKHNTRPKPDFVDAVPSDAIRDKVIRNIRKSKALETYWHLNISPEQLHSEMQRMARDTRNPELLNEIFVTLGSDPAIIAECLARPLLTDRFLRSWYASDDRFHDALKERAESELASVRFVDEMKNLSGNYREVEFRKAFGAADQTSIWRGLSQAEWTRQIAALEWLFPNKRLKPGAVSSLKEDEGRFFVVSVLSQTDEVIRLASVEWQKVPFEVWWKSVEHSLPVVTSSALFPYELPELPERRVCRDDTWRVVSGPPSARYGQAAIWTGKEMIIWGGAWLNSGARYDPATDTWIAITFEGAPDGRHRPHAFWTESGMILWGGYGDIKTGAVYHPGSDSWNPMSVTGAPNSDYATRAVWSGEEMIVWNPGEGTGARYDPGLDTWTPLIGAGSPPPGSSATAVWTGKGMIVWDCPNRTGALYDPASDSWRTMNSEGSPHFYTCSGLWTGSEMILWHGLSNSPGGKYNPQTNTWIPMSVPDLEAREEYSKVWDGQEMIVWGGSMDDGPDTWYMNDGARYNPVTNTWVTFTGKNHPDGRGEHSAVWTGEEMIVWGGFGEGSPTSGGRYNPLSDKWTPTGSNNAPEYRRLHSAVWTGTSMIIWGGHNSVLDFKNGGIYDSVTDSWQKVSNAPFGRINHTAVWSGKEMIVWGGISGRYDRSPLLYDPSSDRWRKGSRRKAPRQAFFHTALWTGEDMLVWGGADARYFGLPLNSGGRYNPETDTWLKLNTLGASSPRFLHSGIQAGKTMIVWGGLDEVFDHKADGGIYSFSKDKWIAPMNESGAPSPRYAHGAEWTGSHMIVWGGHSVDGTARTSGGQYDPESNSWTTISTVNAPDAEFPLTAWTGKEMLVWPAGARYDPATDYWRAMNVVDAPAVTYWETEAWADHEWIIWGGDTNTGEMYCASGTP